MVKDTYYFVSPDKSPEQFIELFDTFYGPTMNAFEAAEKNGKAEELHTQLGGSGECAEQEQERGHIHTCHVHASNRFRLRSHQYE